VISEGFTRIERADDPRVADYRSLKERDLARDGGKFMAEGEYLVRRLLASKFEVASVFVSEKRLNRIAGDLREGVDVFVSPHEVMHEVLGFKFHSGIIACGRRGSSPTIAEVVRPHGRTLLAICPEIANTENLGSMIRIAAAFGVDAMVLGERSCDPFFRQSARVSMGAVFQLPIVRSRDLLSDLHWLGGQGVTLMATVLNDDAEALSRIEPPERVGLLFGNEAQGLSQAELELCDRRITIPMKLGTDSLNVAVAMGVFLYHFTR
jgi:tRNA G18 (ribose-2'-O)-methylase SpoU